MLCGFTGNMGSGKTLSLVSEIYKYYKLGYKIYSNVAFSFPHEKLTLADLIEYNQNDYTLKDCVVVIDEAHIFLDSRTSYAKRNLVISYFLTQTRKKSVKLFYTTQKIHQIDKRLRENTDIIIECSSFKIKDRLYIVQTKIFTYDYRIVKKLLYANPYFSLYDTNQVIRLE